jgi:hypothetical protein
MCNVIAAAAADPPLVNADHDASATGAMLGATRIIPNTFLPDPFIRTKLRFSLGYGRTSRYETPLLEIGGEPILGLEGYVHFAILAFEYRHSVRDWMAVWAHFRVAARLGTEVQSILASGISAYNGMEFGWLFKAYETERHMFSTAFLLRNGSTSLVDILGFVDQAIEDGGIREDNAIMYNTPTLGTALDVRYAYAAKEYLSLQVHGELSYAESVDRATGSEWYYRLGGMLGFDFGKRNGVPVGFVLGYKYTTIPEGGDDIVDDTHSTLLNISYMGRPELGLGVDIEYQWIPLKGYDVTPTFISGILSMQYYF